LPEAGRGAIAFVASLLPAQFIARRARSLGISQIVVLSAEHKRSYEYLKSEVGDTRVTQLGGWRMWRDVAVMARVASARLRGQTIIFFHECCWPAFDVAVSWFKPAGEFYPHVDMTRQFDEVDVSEIPRPFRKAILGLLKNQFIVFRGPLDSGESGHNYFFSMRQYPATIKKFPIETAWEGQEPADVAPASKQIILIGGKDGVEDEYLRSIFLRLIEMARAEGYKVFFKDHPTHRLGVNTDCDSIDPEKPIWLLKERFDFAIGVASVALLNTGRRKLAIVRALEQMPAEVRHRRENHLRGIPNSDRIEFVSSLEEVRTILHEAASAA